MSFYEKHKEILDNAVKAVHERTFFAQYPEHPKAYGEEAPAKGEERFNNMKGNKFSELLQGDSANWVGDEESPYTGEALGISYPAFDADTLVERAQRIWPEWRNIPAKERAGILVEALERIKDRFFDIAHATQHTTGQAFMMSFQASGPHASDRALEAVALGYEELQRFPEDVDWEKPMGKFSVKLKKSWKAIPRGTNLAIGCSTFPVWNTVPGMFAGLVTGNPVIVKPHPGAILPIAIVVAEVQKVLRENNLSPNIIQLAADSKNDPITKKLAEHKHVKLIDYTGGPQFGNYIEKLENKVTFTEKAGVNSVIIDSVDDVDAVFQNLAFAISLYSGQMCTAPQNIFIPETGIDTKDGHLEYEKVVEKITGHIKALVEHPKMGAGTLGAIQNPATKERVENSKGLGSRVLLDSSMVENPEYQNARVVAPVVIEVDASHKEQFSEEHFGPVVMVVKTQSTQHSIELAREMAETKGAITCGAYTTRQDVKEKILEEMEQAFTPVSFNLVGPIWMNQHAAFSDFHVSGGNPAGNATFTNPEYVSKRFVWVGHREAVPA